MSADKTSPVKVGKPRDEVIETPRPGHASLASRPGQLSESALRALAAAGIHVVLDQDGKGGP